MSTKSVIVLVEDNEDDAELTIRAFTQARIGTPIVHLGDGAEALYWLVLDEPAPKAWRAQEHEASDG